MLGELVTVSFLTPSIHSSIRANVPVTVAAASACIGEESVLPGELVLVGEQTFSPAEEGAEHDVALAATVAYRTWFHFVPAVLIT